MTLTTKEVINVRKVRRGIYPIGNSRAGRPDFHNVGEGNQRMGRCCLRSGRISVLWQVGNALASMAYDAVGQYAMLLVAVNVGTWLVPGTVLPGSQLRYSTAEGKEPSNSPPGNWRLHGRTNQGGQWGAWNVSLWQRVS